MKSKALMTGLAAASMVLALALGVQARPFGPGFDDRGMEARAWGLKAFLELKLSDEQQAQVLNIINKYENEKERFRGSMVKARKDIAAALKEATFNEDNARKAFREASALREEMFVLRAKMMSELKAVLTPEQLQLLQERKAQRYEKMKALRARPESSNE
jgi:Spy/CpxP family protein refolding chaperone